jgi:hypothetical protein
MRRISFRDCMCNRGGTGWEGGLLGDYKDNWIGKVADMPATWLYRARVDTQPFAIMLLCPYLCGPLSTRPGTLGETVAHPAGRARRCQRRPEPPKVLEQLLPGPNAVWGGDGRAAADCFVLNTKLFHDSDCIRNAAGPSR